MPAVETQLILADYAQASEGKVNMLGAGWSVTGTPTAHQAVVALLKVPWDQANQSMELVLRLRDEDGHDALVPGASGQLDGVIEFRARLDVGRPTGVKPGTPIDGSFAVNVPSLPLTPGRYSWHLQVGDDECSTSFEVVYAS